MVEGKVPHKLDKLDLEIERQKSAKAKKSQADGIRPQKQNPSKKKSPSKVAVTAAWASNEDLSEENKEVPLDHNNKKDVEATPPTKRKSKQNHSKTRKSTAKQSAVEINFLDASKPILETTQESPRDVIEQERDVQRAKGLYSTLIHTIACETLCHELGLNLCEIKKMKKKYDENDMYHTGQITQAEFFFIINEDRRKLTKGIFKLGTVSLDQKFISFDEYLICVVKFASMTPLELFQFVFDVFDDDNSGALDENEFAQMSRELQSKQFSFPKNVENAIKMMEGKDSSGTKQKDPTSPDGLVDFEDFQKFARLFPVAFFPIFNFQKNVRVNTLSVSKWSKVVDRKLRIQELVRYMREHHGAIPELTLREQFYSLFDKSIMNIRKRAAELYGLGIVPQHSGN